VLKVGGAVAAEAADAAIALAGLHEVCVVHGAGPQISAELEREGLESRFVNGRRVTSEAALAVVRRSLAAVNEAVCAAIGPRAVPLFGDEVGLAATRVPELGHVGSPLPSRPPAVEEALAAGLVPVVAPLGVGPLNVNADEAAAALALGLRADRLLFVTDVPGLLLGGAVATAVRVAEAERLLAAGELGGGIVPKLEAAVTAARGGVEAAIGRTAVLA
jgi:acetylglutamate kinase